MEAVLAVPQDRLVPGHLPRPPRAHRPESPPVQCRRTRLSGHHPRAPRGLPRAVLPRRTVGETLRAQRAAGHPHRDPHRRSAIDQSPPSQADAVPLASTPGPFMSPTMALANGTVIPYRADPTQPFTFRVKLKTQTNATPTDFAVFMNLTTISGLASYATSDFPMTFSPGANSSTNTHNGTWYELTNLNLSNQIYGYGFSVW